MSDQPSTLESRVRSSDLDEQDKARLLEMLSNRHTTAMEIVGSNALVYILLGSEPHLIDEQVFADVVKARMSDRCRFEMVHTVGASHFTIQRLESDRNLSDLYS